MNQPPAPPLCQSTTTTTSQPRWLTLGLAGGLVAASACSVMTGAAGFESPFSLGALTCLFGAVLNALLLPQVYMPARHDETQAAAKAAGGGGGAGVAEREE